MIELIVFDFDGVFSDGSFLFDNSNNIKKFYNGKDSYALKLAKKNNIKCGIITNDKVVSLEHAPHIFDRLDKSSLGSDRPKLDIINSWLQEFNLSFDKVAYIGDDIPDIEILKRAGFSGCPNDAVPQVKDVVDYICKKKGGKGAVREFVDLIISNNKKSDNVCFCIPARYNSTRLNKKLLLPLGKYSCIQHTIQKLYKSSYFNDNIYVFTDSPEIKSHLHDSQCKIILTQGEYKNGTERIAKNLNMIDKTYDIVVNIQADEPFISSKNIDYCINKHLSHAEKDTFYSTLHETNNENEYLKSTASLKVIVDKYNNVIYYSRNLIPFNKSGMINPNIKYKTFTGIYVYDINKIIDYGNLNNTFLQDEEDCEQLKVLEHGFKIKSYDTVEFNEISLNTEEDYAYLLNKYCKTKKSYILDCTLRDGGYINNWRFSETFIKDYKTLMQNCNIDFVEIGFLNKPRLYKSEVVGKCRNIDQEYLDQFINRKFKTSVLCDYKVINIDLLKNKKNLQIIDLVRVAFHKHNMLEAIETCSIIKDLGYKVSVNAMAITNYNEKELDILLDKVNSKSFDILYIADSYGSLQSFELKDYISKFDKKLTQTNIGIHLHNNMNNAYHNYLTNKDINIDKNLYIDSTIFGMGRGAGNLQTELVIFNTNKSENKINLLTEILIFIDEHLTKIYNNNIKVKWGYYIDYFLSGLLKMHPNYINKFRDIELNFKSMLLLIKKICQDNKQAYFDLEYVNKLINQENGSLI